MADKKPLAIYSGGIQEVQPGDNLLLQLDPTLALHAATKQYADTKRVKLTPTATKTGAYTAVSGDLVICDGSAGGFTVTLPAAVPGAIVAVRKGDSGPNVITIAAAGSDTIGVLNAVSSVTVQLTGQVIELVGITGGWVPYNGLLSLSALDTRYAAGSWLGMATTVVGPSAAGGLTANRTTYNRVVKGTIPNATKIAMIVGTSSGNISVGIYRNSGTAKTAVPGAFVAGTGSVACPAAGYAEVALGGSYSVSEGDWLALVADNTSATFYKLTGNGLDNAPWGLSQGSAFPVPTTVGTVGQSNHQVTLMAVP